MSQQTNLTHVQYCMCLCNSSTILQLYTTYILDILFTEPYYCAIASYEWHVYIRLHICTAKGGAKLTHCLDKAYKAVSQWSITNLTTPPPPGLLSHRLSYEENICEKYASSLMAGSCLHKGTVTPVWIWGWVVRFERTKIADKLLMIIKVYCSVCDFQEI